MGIKLHLGCGPEKMRGWVNCDISPEVQPDKIVDLEKKLPFEDDSVEKIYTKNTLEHIRNVLGLMKEIHRVCEAGAIVTIRVPFYSSYAYASSLEHVTRFAPSTFGCLSDLFEVKYRVKFFVEKKRGVVGIIQKLIDKFIKNHTYFYCRFLANIIPSSEIEYFLKVKKEKK